ncbi:MAG: hypothetical protein ACLGHQ_15240, partial [Acidimicrobiia bacterium]
MSGYWHGDGPVHLAGGTLSRSDVEGIYADDPDGVLDRMLELMGVTLSSASRAALVEMSRQCS